MITNKINMRIIFLFLLGVIAFIAPVQRLVAQQQYPVHIQPTVSFPSTLLNDYSDPANTNIRVYLADLSKLNYTINIRIALTSGSISYKSIHGINVTLDGGQVYFLNANELSRLFALTDLTIAPAATNNEPNSLPEGVYSLALESFDASLLPNIVIPVSNIRTDFTIFNVVRYDPPLLNSPTNKQEFDLQTTNQNIFFNWTPRSISYSPSQHIQYRYRMIRVIPVDRNPYDAVNTTLAGATGNIDVNALDFATFIYSPTDLPLIPGSVYAWQVQAYEMINGVVSTSRFKNQGFSEVFTFSIKENCAQITLAPAVITGNSVSFTWNIGDASSVYNEYEFNYRAVSSATGWIPISTTQNTITLDNTVLQTGIIYEYNVRARCNNWLLPVQGVNFILATPTCVAPTPITVNTTGTTTALSWAKATSVDSLKLYYKITGSTDPFTTLVLNPGDIQCNIPLLTSGGYTIHLDAFCGSEQTAGITNSFAYNETGIVGPCPIPLPFQLIATRIKGDTANLKWNTVNGAHTGSSITYWHKDSSTVTYNYNALTTSSGTGVTGIHVYDDQVYSYQITYLCGTKNQTTPIGMFRILSASAKVNIDPPTANCFPPVGIRAEARDSVTARVEWDKISGADNYELSYRVKGSRLPFTTFNTTATNATLKPLQKNAQYQLLVRVKCSSVFSIYSDTALVDLTVARNRNCDTATFFKALKKTTNNIQTAWNFDATCTGYIIKFREEAQPLASEYTQAFTNIDSLKHNNVLLDTVRYTFQNLKSGTRYVFRIQKICGQNNALFNLPLIATTLADAKSSGACGSGNVCNKDSTTKLKSMVVGDTIYCADYQVVVDSVTTAKSNPSMGIYSGLGHMEMPVPGLGDFVSMHVSFKNVKINGKPNSCVYGGVINIDSMNASIIPTGIRDSVKAIMAKAQGLIDEANAALAEAQGAIDKLQAGLQQGINYFQGGDGVGNVVTGKLGETDIQTDIPTSTTSAGINGNTITIGGKNITVAALPVLLRDNTDEVFQVTSTGAVTYVGKYDTAFAKNPSLDLTGKIVTYSEFSGATYDFDKREAAYSVSIQIDREYEKIGTSYYVPAKFIIPGELDKVTATFSGTVAEASKVVFSNGTGFVYDKGTQPGKTFTLNLAGGPASDGQYIYAWYVDGSTKKAIGKLLLPSYAPQVKNVVLVPVKGKQTFNAATYETYLNETYQKIGITYHVTVDESFRTNTSWATSPTDLTVQSSASNLLSNDYQGKERAIVEAYVAFKGAANIDPNTAYFIAVYEPSKIESKLLGKMPAEEQFGFLYSGSFSATGSAQDGGLKRTMAHELGHGAYHMEHTFNSIYLGTSSSGNTANLMDYSAGNELWKFQWDIVYSPGHVWGILKRDKDAQAVQNRIKNYLFVDPAGNAFNLELGATNGISLISAVKYGVIISFQNNTTKYTADIHDGNFYGYKGSDNSYYEEKFFEALTDKIYFVSGSDNSLLNTSAKQIGVKYGYVNIESIDSDNSTFYRIASTQKTIAQEPPVKYPTKTSPAPLFIWNSVPTTDEYLFDASPATFYFQGDIVTEIFAKIGDEDVTLLTASKSSTTNNGLAKSADELKNKYISAKAEPGTLLSFYENGFIVTIDEFGNETATAISQSELANKIASIENGDITTDGEILFQTTVNSAGKTIINSTVGYNKSLQPTKTGFAFSGQDRINIQNYQKSKINTYLSNNNVSDLRVVDSEKSTTNTFPDNTKTVILECSYFTKFCKITKETGQFIKDCQIPDRFYDPSKTGYSDCIVNTSPYFSGVGNGMIDELKSIPELVVLATDIILDEDVRNGLVATFTELDFDKIKNGIVNSGQQFVGDLLSTAPSGWHSKGKFTVTIVTTIMGAGILSKGDDLLKKSDDALGDITNINKNLDDLAENTLSNRQTDVSDFLSKNPDIATDANKVADLNDGVIDVPDNLVSSKFGKVEDLNAKQTTYNSSGKKGQGWDRELNSPKANWTYKVGNYTYKTDNLGRVKEVEVSGLQKVANADDFRNSYQQSIKCKSSKNGLDGDDGGHLIGSQFGGPGEQINVIPMSSSVNRSGGAWYNMETQWSNALNSNKTVTNIKIEINYNGDSLRPTDFDVTWLESGVSKAASISN